MKYGYTAIRRKAGELWQGLWWKSRLLFLSVSAVLIRLGRELTPLTCRILSTFAAEAAVLILVFPPLEFFLARRGTEGVQPVAMRSVWRWSAIFCVGFLVVSVLLALVAARKSAEYTED